MLIVVALFVLHQDVWFWHRATPFVLGVLPIGLFYHAAYTLLTAAVLWMLVRYAWPADLDREPPPE
jgi:hypothetical protein